MVEEGLWTIEHTDGAGLTVSHSEKVIFNQAYGEVTYNILGRAGDYTFNTLSAAPSVETVAVSDEFGTGKSFVLTYDAGNALVRHTLSFYPSLPYMIVSLSVESTEGKTLQSRYLKAWSVNASSNPLTGASNRVVWVPFDNDAHLKYEIFQLKNNKEMTSHEVGYVFDGDSGRGIIAGSVDHDKWKSGITIAGTNGYKVEKFDVVSGHTSSTSRDIIPHGKVKGEKVSSARYFIGVYDDWRQGLNDFADANTKVAPRAEWERGNPMGWSSWGVQQNYINYAGVYETAVFMKENLYDLGFHDRYGQMVISLDSFNEDNISQVNLYNLGTKIFGEGEYKDGKDTKQGMNMVLGEYGGHLVAWEWSLDSKVPGTGLNGTRDYTYRDMCLRVNGNIYRLNSSSAFAVDPTHPAVKAGLEAAFKKFAGYGVKYVKMDFLNSGICEGDSWYDPEVTTGVQAYNYGMKLMLEEAKKYDMYIVESISPIFPYQYAHGRRTCCDRFSEIGESEYVMNAISYGWWTDRLYVVNDPDQLVLCKGNHGAKETLGENRARATSGMATGAYIFGDNFSDNVFYTDNNGHRQGDVVGYPEESRKRALEIMGNPDINEYVRNHTGSFMPVYGNKPSTGQSSESVFMRLTDDALYVAVFNWNTIYASNGEVEWSRLGVNPEDIVEIKELWTGEVSNVEGEALKYSVPSKDARVYRMAFSNFQAGIERTEARDSREVFLQHTGARRYHISAGEDVGRYLVYDLSGKCLLSGVGNDVDLQNVSSGLYFVEVILASGHKKAFKVINH